MSRKSDVTSWKKGDVLLFLAPLAQDFVWESRNLVIDGKCNFPLFLQLSEN